MNKQTTSLRTVMFNKDNKLTPVDIYLLLFLKEQSASNHIVVNADLWIALQEDMKRLNISYSITSFRNSIMRLNKANIITKIAHSIYSRNLLNQSI